MASTTILVRKGGLIESAIISEIMEQSGRISGFRDTGYFKAHFLGEASGSVGNGAQMIREQLPASWRWFSIGG
jgi:hypothetical protein